MPRRNRNVHAVRLDADELADQAAQLTAELGRATGHTPWLIDETQVHAAHSGTADTWTSTYLHPYLRKALNASYSISVIDAKAVTSHGRN